MQLEYGPTDKELVFTAETESELAKLLRTHICSGCLDEAGLTMHHGSLSELMSTPCGCEWWFEE
jgi:hypothetical protein